MSQETYAIPESEQRNCEQTGEVRRNQTDAEERNHQSDSELMEAVVERSNMMAALRKVVSNKGKPGVDGLTVEELGPWLKENWPLIREKLLTGRYKPWPVRRVDIPKPGGGMRQLGIPSVLDRLIQQALLQQLTPIFDPTFSDHSYGFRPGRSAHDAVIAAQRYVAEGRVWVVDMDLEKFFDRVNHDILMSRVFHRVKDKRVLRLIGNYLKAGIMHNGVVSARTEGTPQGGPLSPLLSNILLDALDRELEKRGHKFCRYADDCNIYVKTERSGQRVIESITGFLEGKLRLRVNRSKSAVGRPSRRKFLGYSIIGRREPRPRVSKESVQRLRMKLKECFRMGKGRNIRRFITDTLNPILRGWFNYYRLSTVKTVFEKLDSWIRRHLRKMYWRQWKKPRTRMRKLQELGLSRENTWRTAYNGHGPWYNSGTTHMNRALPKRIFDYMNLFSLLDSYYAVRNAT